MSLVIFLLSLLTALGMWEMNRLVRHRRRIPIRVHVNGSRGKSSVARLIAAGLRAGGLAVVAKTTGSAAAIIHTDGSETPVRRRGAPNIKEQVQVMRTAAREKCQALVLECMAVRPDLQKVCEQSIVRATHGVITNVRPDHLEVMGPTLDDVAASLAGTVPARAHLFAADDRYDAFLAGRARRARSVYTRSDATGVTRQEMQGFRYVEFPENVSLALAVCQSVGVSREKALAGMYGVRPDVGALTRWVIPPAPEAGLPHRMTFINGFAVNDPESYLRVWRHLDLAASPEQVFILMNIRADRQRRSKDLAPLLGHQLTADRYLLIGQDTALFADMLRRNGVPRDRILDLHSLDAPQLWARICSVGDGEATVFGMGNIAGIGGRLLDHLRDRRLSE
jgi:poly-gamma-glutamate synthase PgsB/CapB